MSVQRVSPAPAPGQPAASTGDSEVDSIIAGLQGGTTQQRQFLGVSPTYKAPGRESGFQIGGDTGDVDRGYSIGPPIAPKYKDDDQFLGFAGLDPASIMRLQIRMRDAGVLKQKYTPGVWDPVTETAMETLMVTANKSGKEWSEVLDQWAAGAAVAAKDAAGGVLTVSSPEDIAAVVKQAATKVLGRGLSAGEVDQLVASYQNIDRSAQEAEAAAKAQAAQTGEVIQVTEAPTATNFAENTLRQQNAGEAKYMSGIQRMNEFYSILGEAGGGLGNG